MRVGIVSEYYRPWPGGISEHVHHEALELRRLGHQVWVITGSPAASGAMDEPFVLRLGHALHFTSNGARSSLAVGSFLWKLRSLFCRLALDVVHVHAPLDPCLPLCAVLSAPCPVLGTFHASFPTGAFWKVLYGAANPLARTANLRLHTRIAVSEEARRSIAPYLPGELRILPNGVDLARFSPAGVAQREPRAALRLLFVGRSDPRKGLPLLIAAYAELRARALPVTLSLCGVTSQEAEPLLRTLAPQARAAVRCMGYVDPEALPARYAEADLLVSPALGQESQGVVLLEAMASGVPTVCFDIPGYREVVQDGLTGLLVSERTGHALAQALFGLSRDTALRAGMAERARIVAARYAWPALARRIESELLAACNGSQPSAAEASATEATC